ncbi:flavodoxin family protein [Terrisporobacter glycolicus]|uniref:Flavodoxin-like domain-containing protein n=1 Tax=Terrisporobacter glycolicus ATCC 14880 = DSM 1288 TaxID=1121315 RepID=A0ABZ2EQ53_9FIRM|nr:flavodoxin [Terrisporobacter glycolicus]
MKNLVVFYSLEGNTKLITDIIAQKTNADVLELKPKKKYHNSGFKKYFWGGRSVLFKEKPELSSYNINIDDYDNIFIGTPIWVGTYASPYNTFLNQETICDKNIYLFACHGGGGADKFYKNIKEMIPKNNFKGEIDFKDPLEEGKEEVLDKINTWLNNVYLNN